MNDKQRNRLPPIVENYIATLTNPRSTVQSKAAAESVIRNIVEQCNIALAEYDKPVRKVARK